MLSSASKIVGALHRTDTVDDSSDPYGYIYIFNIVQIYAGGFDLLVACTDMGGGLAEENPPNETITFFM